jgi:C4-type Zn-finger protein
MIAIQKIKVKCPKCENEFYADNSEFKFMADLVYGKEKIMLHCFCKKCKVKLELEV